MKSDILVENFMPTTMPKLGLGFEHLKKIAPHLIYCSISGNTVFTGAELKTAPIAGYGSEGPWANRGGFDVVAAAIGGFLNITGPIVCLL